MLYVAIGIIGATVMPHNLYLHSALVQSRKLQKDESAIRTAIRFNTIDSAVALTLAFFVNAAILVLAAMVFYGKDQRHRAGRASRPVQRQHRLDPHRLSDPRPAAGRRRRQPALRHRAAGQRPGQHHHRHARRPGRDGRLHALAALSRGSAESSPACWPSFPPILIIGIRGDSSINDLINLSQVVLALQLPLAMFPLLHFTSSRKRMGNWKSGWFLLITGMGQRDSDHRVGHLRTARCLQASLASHRRRITADAFT